MSKNNFFRNSDGGNGVSGLKRFSISKKLLLVFGILITAAGIIQGSLALYRARKAVMEKVSIHLTDKAKDTAALIDAKTIAFFQFIEGLTRLSFLRDNRIL